MQFHKNNLQTGGFHAVSYKIIWKLGEHSNKLLYTSSRCMYKIFGQFYENDHFNLYNDNDILYND